MHLRSAQKLRLCTKYQRWSRGLKARGHGQGHKKISRPRPRTDPLDAKAKDQEHRRKCSPKKNKVFKKNFQAISKKGLQKFFSGEKGLQKLFFRQFPFEENKTRSSQIFSEVSGAFQQNFNRPRTEDRPIFENWRLRGQGQGLQNVSSRSRTSSRTPPLLNTLPTRAKR